MAPQPKPGILDINVYVPGKSQAAASKVYKLSSNESPFGSAESARAAYLTNAQNLELYPDGSAAALRLALAERYGLNPANIVCGAGSDELLQLLAHAYVGEGDEVVYSQYGFMVYPIVIQANGGKAVVASETDYQSDVDALLACVKPKTKMVLLANPNNPTGTYLPIAEVKRLHAGLPNSTLLVLDAAYAEYVRRNDYESGIELVSTSQNVVMTRTFSKIYGLAAARLGWCYAPAPIADVLNRIRGPFNTSSAAQAAGVAALKDHAFVERAITHNQMWLEKLRVALKDIGLATTPSVGNFLLMHFPQGKKSAAAADEFLQNHGLIVRRMDGYGLPQALRVTVGTDEANQHLIATLTEFMR